MAKNYLLGHAERLTSPIQVSTRPPDKSHPFTFEEALQRLSQPMDVAAATLRDLPSEACPGGEAVLNLTLLPNYLAKSYFPDSLIRHANVRLIGSRSREIIPPAPKKTPETRKTRDKANIEYVPELYVAGDRSALIHLSDTVRSWRRDSPQTNDFRKLHDIRVTPAEERMKRPPSPATTVWEVVLHAEATSRGASIVSSFIKYLQSIDSKARIDEKRILYSSGLCFLSVHTTPQTVRIASDFAFLRCVRSMPQLRPITRQAGYPLSCSYTLPTTPPLDETSRALILDTGGPAIAGLEQWVKTFDADGVGAPDPAIHEHGLQVNSAFLFGPIIDGQPLPQPYCRVDHARVIGDSSDAPEYIDTLLRIQNVLQDVGHNYDIICICCGPDIPVDDDDPTAWTAVLDPIFAKLPGLVFCAAGNSGHRDHDSGIARVQPPADCVNAVSVGSCNSLAKSWNRSFYSSIGPGRRPGIVKPDVLAFGGELPHSPFFALSRTANVATATQGTSFSTPLAARIAAGIRAQLGRQLGPLAIKALLISRSESSTHDIKHVGWGRIVESPESLIVSPDNEAFVVYQGLLSPGQWLRAPIPLPEKTIPGMVTVSATFCFHTETDPHHPVNYTRAGLGVTFRPHSEKKKDPNSRHAATTGFFELSKMYPTEHELRRESLKWESVLHRRKRFRGSSLNDPVFDIHYNAREEGAPGNAPQIPYSLVVRISSPKVADLYNQIATRYRTILQPIQPVRVAIAT